MHDAELISKLCGKVKTTVRCNAGRSFGNFHGLVKAYLQPYFQLLLEKHNKLSSLSFKTYSFANSCVITKEFHKNSMWVKPSMKIVKLKSYRWYKQMKGYAGLYLILFK